MAEIGLREFTEGDSEALTAFLTGNDWPFYVRLRRSPEQVAEGLADGSFHLFATYPSRNASKALPASTTSRCARRSCAADG
jgi:hypothetical protein